MKLQENSTAPAFETQDIYGHSFNLSDYQGKRILLSFFRNVACPFCNLRVHQLKKLAPELKEEGLEMVFVFETPKKHILMSSLHSTLQPISIISDSEKLFYKLYHIETSMIKFIGSIFKSGFQAQMKMAKELGLDKIEDEKKNSSIIPADFLIDEKGVIQKVHYGNAVNDHMPIDTIRQFASDSQIVG
ncbi:MAG: redoxin domain-containing protein [Raineya sp.]|jgi:peroxiredoxin|nr:redoxin domain-containing protein [Raineya sp.]